MLSSSRGKDFTSSSSKVLSPMDYTRSKRGRTLHEDWHGECSSALSREKRQKWMSLESTEKQGQDTGESSATSHGTKIREGNVSPTRASRFHDKRTTTFSTPRSSQILARSPCFERRGKQPHSRRLSSKQQPPSDSYYCQPPSCPYESSRPSSRQHNRRHPSSSYHRSSYHGSPSYVPQSLCRPVYQYSDRHRRSRRPSPWRRAPPYLRKYHTRRRGRAGDYDYGWNNHLSDHNNIRDFEWKSARRIDYGGYRNGYDRHRKPYSRKDEYYWKKRKWSREARKPGTTSEKSLTETRVTKKQKSTKNEDEIVHFEWLPGMKLNTRYVVCSQLGEGTFGRVLECRDAESGRRVAIKVVRDISRYTSAAQIEAEILEEVREKDPENESNCVQLIERFLFDKRRGRERRASSLQPRKSRDERQQIDTKSSGNRRSESSSGVSNEENFGAGVHMCLVSEKLGLSLFAFLSKNKYRGFFVEDIQQISLEILKALAFLRKIRLTHTDLKPENILFLSHTADRVAFPRSRYPPRFWDGDASDQSEDDNEFSAELSRMKPTFTERPRDCRVKLIDFGSATFEDDSHCSLINTRQYRAPEVILHVGWSTPSDLWCLGCIVMELYTGVLLFRTHEHLEHLALIERIVGPLPQNMLQAASHTEGAKYLSGNERLRLDWPEGASSQKSLDKVKNSRTLEDMVLPCHRLFASFVRYLLQIDPAQRPTPTEAMRHPFLNTVLPEG